MVNYIEEALVFDVWSDYSCFRQPYTTTSVLSFPFPPRTSVTGLIASILGLPKDSYNETLFGENQSRIAIRILSSLEKIRFGMNLLDTKYGFTPQEIARKNQPPRIQIPFEFFKNAKYRIYVWLNDIEIFNKLESQLKSHKSVYTPYLGLAFLIADFNFVGRFKVELKKGDAEINSIVPTTHKLKIEPNKRYGRISNVPVYMDNSRRVLKFMDFYIEWTGKPLLLENVEYYQIGSENVIFF
jgi:CRISPR-associated protein Cas5h